MSQQNYTSFSIWIINAIILVFLLISSCSAREYDLAYVNKNFFQVLDESETYMGICLYPTGNYTNSSQYHSNLLTVFANLTAEAKTAKTSFFNTKSGTGNNNTVYASFFCPKSDLDVCSYCVQNSTEILLDFCAAKVGIVYTRRTNCQVRYANSLTFPEKDGNTSVMDCISNLPNAPDPVVFSRRVEASFEKLIDEVAVAPDGFANDTISDLYLGQEVYTVVRCLPGVSRPLCKDCLVQALNDTGTCLSQGDALAISYQPSCRMAYNIWNPLTAPNSSSPGGGGFVNQPLSPKSSPPRSASPGLLESSIVGLWIIVATIILL